MCTIYKLTLFIDGMCIVNRQAQCESMSLWEHLPRHLYHLLSMSFLNLY